MTRWRDGQGALGEVILFGVVGAPEKLMYPVLRRIDALLDDEALVGAVWRVLRKLRIDTTVVEAAIRYPTDSGLCEDSIRVLSRAMRAVAAAGVSVPVRLRNVRRSVTRRMREIAQAVRLRGEAARAALGRPYRGLLRITGRIVRQAERTVAATREQAPQLREGA